MRFSAKKFAAIAIAIGLSGICVAQTAATPDQAKPAAPAAPPAAPPPVATPSITGPLSAPPALIFDAGPAGNIAVNGILSGMGSWSSNYIPGDNSTQAALSNGQVFIQKTDGWFQFYLQAGAYNLSSLGVPFLATDKTMTNLYGPVPMGYVKLQAGKTTQILAGALPTLIGAEYTFSFENMNVNRGLLWNQENAITRGVQVNQTMGKFTASLSWTDGFYSNRYNWLTGSLAYTNGAHTIAFVGGGNAGQNVYQTFATPVQNNGKIYNIIYTYNKGNWIVQPYWQYTSVPTNAAIGVAKGNATNGGAILLSHNFGKGFSLPVRWEYIASTASDPNAVNLMYGPGSAGTSFTVTPTYQKGGFFVRGDLAWVHVSDFTPGSAFGQSGTNANQPRAMAEIGFIFGNNIEPKK